MRSPAPLSVDVVDDRDIVVCSPTSGFEVRYRRERFGRMLVSTDTLRNLTAEKAAFLASAWKVAFEKALSLGWLKQDTGHSYG